jgi:excisionase family DNA binding protein
MLFVLIILNAVILFQVYSTGKLWNKPLTPDEIKTVRNMTAYPLIISLISVVLGFVLFPALSIRGNIGNILSLLMLTGVPLVSLIITTVGVPYVFYTAKGQPSKTSRISRQMSVSQAAQFLNITEDELLSLVTSGKLRARKANGQYRFDPEILRAFQSLRK